MDKIGQKDNSYRGRGRRPFEWIIGPVLVEFKWLRRPFLKGLRFAWRKGAVPTETVPRNEISIPTGPFAMKRKGQMGDLLLWVPRRIDSFLIDDLTGRFGYSHLTVDTGEVDLPTGKPVMVEVTVGQVVERKFQDEYADRPYSRIPLSKTGIDVDAFIDCVKSRFGEPYGNLEALTLGEIVDPAKQVCTSLASECLPETVRRDIANARRLGVLRRTSVSVHSPSNAPETKVFISPNGFAQYYGAPEGEKLPQTDFLVEPRPVETPANGAVRRHNWGLVALLAAAGALAAGTCLLIVRNSRAE